MPVKKYEWTEAKFKKYLKEGRGQGTGKDYKPWLKTYSVPSRGKRAPHRAYENLSFMCKAFIIIFLLD
jgi:hypothetical protein